MLIPCKFVLRNLVAPASLPALAFRGTVNPACPEPRRDCALGFSSRHNYSWLCSCSAGIPAGSCFSWHSHAWLCFWVSPRRGAAPAAGGRPISAQSQPFAIPNPPEAGEARVVRPARFVGVRYGFPSHVLCAMNLSSLEFVLSCSVNPTEAARSFLARRIVARRAFLYSVIPTGATAPSAVAQWRDRGKT
jgi:hypothetical protein